MGDIVNGRRYGKEPTQLIDPHCVPVVPAHALRADVMPHGNILLTIITHQVDTDGQTIGVVTCRVEWQRERLTAAQRQVGLVLDGSELAVMEPANVLAG